MLARLLATENISVVHQNVPTAFFDLKTRSLHLPLWSNASGALYDMLVGHEVAHALFTPAAGWKDAIGTVSAATGAPESIAKQYLNIVEDARIERMIQSKFRGLKGDFMSAYKTLMEREFFGDLSDIGSMVFADRFNLHFKCGVHAGTAVRFSAEEQVMVDRGAAITTWEEVVALATDMIRYANEQAQKQKQQQMEMESDEDGDTGTADMGDAGDPAEGGEESEDGESNTGTAEGESQDGTDGAESKPTDEQQGEDGNGKGKPSKQHKTPTNAISDSDPIAPSTNEALERALQEFADTKGEVQEIVRITTNDLAQCAKIVDYKGVLADMRGCAMSRYMGTPVRISDYTTASVTMATAFNRRKAADNWRRTTVAKSGSLDTLRMNQYKWTDDIFRRTTRIADGKNHGIVILLDWSSSMSSIMQSTMGQLFILADFCRKCSIPFEVYAFSDGLYTSSGNYYDKTTAAERDAFYAKDSARRENFAANACAVTMLNLLSSRMGGTEYEAMKSCLWNWRQMGTADSRYSLNGTPTTAGLLAAADLVKDFITRTRVQIAHTVVLTDGEPTDELAFNWHKHRQTNPNTDRYGTGVAVVLTDPVTGAAYDMNAVQRNTKDVNGYRQRDGFYQFGCMDIPKGHSGHLHSLIAVDIVRRRTGSRMHWVGLRYTGGGRVKVTPEYYAMKSKNADWKRDGYIAGTVWGWDTAIVVDADRILRDANGTVSSNAQRILQKANEKMDNAGSNRTLANAFIESQMAQGSLRTVATHIGEFLAV